jgi:sterol desaturase/sphingolipid hydroxylase (fatty acid hydroxylase superfamily)
MNNADNEDFRHELRKQAGKNYSPIRHMCFNGLISLLPIIIFITLLWNQEILLLSLLAIPCGIILGNLIEYLVHRYPMHQRLWSKNSRMYKRHAGQHHRAFNHQFMTIDNLYDLSHITLPTKYVAIFSVISTLCVLLISIFLLGSFGYILGIVLSLYFFIEEILHASFHTQWMWQAENILRPLAEHHRKHHETSKMRKWNFNILFPLFDIIFKTRLK